ncbi:hypothetical protein [Streptomyces sp. NPDC047009]|uniref:hypothetical protein n=1 Tax=Streptomyces sp. NPDC047009 TaxID=3154496 RepID=UPI0033EDC9D7
MTEDLYTRAAKIFRSDLEWGIHWPYEAAGLDWTLRKKDPERYRRELDAYTRQRTAIVEWAERYGLKKSRVTCCPWWLTRSTSRRCEFSKCTHHGSGEQISDHHWLDHAICWIKDGKPAVITSSPYDISYAENYEDRVPDYGRIKWWVDSNENLSVTFGKGWYGSSTTQVVMWRNDRIPVVEPGADGGWCELMRRSRQMAYHAA